MSGIKRGKNSFLQAKKTRNRNIMARVGLNNTLYLWGRWVRPHKLQSKVGLHSDWIRFTERM